MSAYLVELGLALLPVWHPQVHPALPRAAVGLTGRLGGVSLFVHEHVLDELYGQAEYGPVESRRVLGRPVVDAPTTAAEATHDVVEPLDAAVQLVLTSLSLQPGESDLPVQLDDCSADLFWPLSVRVQDVIRRRRGQLPDARRQGVDELEPVTLAEQVELVAVDELLDRVVGARRIAVSTFVVIQRRWLRTNRAT